MDGKEAKYLTKPKINEFVNITDITNGRHLNSIIRMAEKYVTEKCMSEECNIAEIKSEIKKEWEKEGIDVQKKVELANKLANSLNSLNDINKKHYRIFTNSEKSIEEYKAHYPTGMGDKDHGVGYLAMFQWGAQIHYSPGITHRQKHLVIVHEIGHILMHIEDLNKKNVDPHPPIKKWQEHEATLYAEWTLQKLYENLRENSEFMKEINLKEGDLREDIKGIYKEYDPDLIPVDLNAKCKIDTIIENLNIGKEQNYDSLLRAAEQYINNKRQQCNENAIINHQNPPYRIELFEMDNINENNCYSVIFQRGTIIYYPKNKSNKDKYRAIAHEIGHILLHASIIENNESGYVINFRQEEEAIYFAAKIMEKFDDIQM